MRGFHERLIGVVKTCLRKTIGKLCLTSEQLRTFLAEAEAVVNSRPLVYVGDDINSNIQSGDKSFGGKWRLHLMSCIRAC